MATRPDQEELLRLAKAKLGISPKGRATGDTELARRLGWDTGTARQRVRRGSGLTYEQTWSLLDALGWIKTEFSNLELIENAVKRLDEGEAVPKKERDRLAARADDLSGYLKLLGVRLREGAGGARKPQ